MDFETEGAPRARRGQSNETADENVASEDETGTSRLAKNKDADFWAPDEPARTTRYNYAHEKSLSHVDAKLFYQRHKFEVSQQETEAFTPPLRARTVSSTVNFDLDGLSRANSTASRRSDHTHARNDQSARSPLPLGLSSRAESANHFDLSSCNPNNVGPYESQLGQERLGEAYTASEVGVGNESIGIEAEFATLDTESSNIAPEMRTICSAIKRVQEIRHKYIGLSLQGPDDNPKDEAGWVIHPPPPEPVWDDVKNRPRSFNSGTNSLASSRILTADQGHSRSTTAQQAPLSPAKRPRKQGQDIGEDFELSDLLPLPGEDGNMSFKLDGNSVFQVYENLRAEWSETPVFEIPTLRDFYKDLEYIIDISSDGPSKSFAFRALDILEGKFNLYFLVNTYEETAICKRVPHRDFYNVRKVDTHVHHSACMNQKHLLRFIKSKMKKSPNEVVMFRDGKHLTLAEVFESINLTAYDLSIDTLDMHVRY